MSQSANFLGNQLNADGLSFALSAVAVAKGGAKTAANQEIVLIESASQTNPGELPALLYPTRSIGGDHERN